MDAADILLIWAAQSGNVNTIPADKVKTDEATGLPLNTKGKVYFNSSSIGLSLVKETPEISDDGKSLTLKYTKPYADWQYDIEVKTPAHITAEKALGIADAQEAKDALVKAIQDKDEAALVKISEFWNTGYDYTKMPDDPDLALSSGAYVMKEFKENEYMTLVKNEDFKGDRDASIDELTIRWSEDPLAQVQALENGELDLFSPQVTSDVVKAAEKIEDAAIETGVEGTFEHFDLVMNNKGPFDPSSYGGDEQKALAVRKAFLHGIPRQEVVDKLIKPINPEAEVRNSFIKTEGTPGYDEIVAQNGSADYAEVDPALSLKMLKDAGVKTPIDVRVMYAKDNVRRQNEFQLYKPALAKAGFNLIDKGRPGVGPEARRRHLRRRLLRLELDYAGGERRPGDLHLGWSERECRLCEQGCRSAVRHAGRHIGPERAGQDPDRDREAPVRGRHRDPDLPVPLGEHLEQDPHHEHGSRHPRSADVLRVLGLEGSLTTDPGLRIFC